MIFTPLPAAERDKLLAELRRNATAGAAIRMNPLDTGWVPGGDEPTDEEVIASIASVPCHYAELQQYRLEAHDLDGCGSRKTRVYDMAPVHFVDGRDLDHPTYDYWAAVTNVGCPCCDGTIRWAEAGYVPGYRICDGCGRHFLAKGDGIAPTLLRVGSRRSEVRHE